jgi:hypothetical protein
MIIGRSVGQKNSVEVLDRLDDKYLCGRGHGFFMVSQDMDDLEKLWRKVTGTSVSYKQLRKDVIVACFETLPTADRLDVFVKLNRVVYDEL